MRSRKAAVLVSLAVLLLGTGAWLLFAGESDPGPEQSHPTSTPTIGVTATTTESAPTRTGNPTPATPTRRSTQPSNKPPAGSSATTVADAEGWRLEIYQPAPGATIGKKMTSCYEVTGTSREPVLELEAALTPIGGGDAAGRTRTAIAVGRGSAAFSFEGVRDGRYDLRLRLKVDGRWISGLTVTVENVRLAAGTPPAGCG